MQARDRRARVWKKKKTTARGLLTSKDKKENNVCVVANYAGAPNNAASS